MMRILVFGISGFTGHHFSKFLKSLKRNQRCHVVGADRVAPRAGSVVPDEFFSIDATNRDSVQSAIHRAMPDYVINLTGTFTGRSYEEYISLNVDVTRNILTELEGTVSVKKILVIGSAAEYGRISRNPVTEDSPENPVTLYGLTKLFQTRLCRYHYQTSGVPVVVARTFNVYGEGISEALSVGSFQAQIREAVDGGVIRVGNLDSERDFLPIESVVSLYWILLKHGTPGEVYNVCSGNPTRMSRVLEEMIKASGKHLTVERDSNRVKEFDVSCIYGDRGKLDSILEESGESQDHQ